MNSILFFAETFKNPLMSILYRNVRFVLFAKTSFVFKQISTEPGKSGIRRIKKIRCKSTYQSQECIPVKCILPAAVAVSWGGSASVHAGIHPQGVGLETPLCVGLENARMGVGLETPPRCGPGDPPGDLQGMLGYNPTVNRITDTCKI